MNHDDSNQKSSKLALLHHTAHRTVRQWLETINKIQKLSRMGQLTRASLENVDKSLDNVTRARGQIKDSVLESCLQSLCQCFQSQLRPTSLQDLNHDPRIKLFCKLHFTSKKRNPRRDVAKAFYDRLRTCQLHIASLVNDASASERNAGSVSPNHSESECLDLEKVALLYKALADHWGRCRCNPRHKANLRLFSCSAATQTPVTFEMLFDARPLQWHEVSIKAGSQRANNRRLRFADLEEHPDQATQGQYFVPTRPDHRFCMLTDNGRQRLNLIASQDRGQRLLLYNQSRSEEGSGRMFCSLRDVLQQESQGNTPAQLLRGCPREQLYLACLVTTAVMQLYGSPWLSQEWTNTSITFKLNETDNGSLTTILNTHFCLDVVAQAVDPSFQAVLLDLALLIMEIESGNLRERYRNKSDLDRYGNDYQSTAAVVADRFYAALQCSKQTWNGFKTAVQACLKPTQLDCDVESVRQYIQRRVLEPLKQSLEIGYNLRLGEVDCHMDIDPMPDIIETDDSVVADSDGQHEAFFFDSDVLESGQDPNAKKRSKTWIDGIIHGADRMLSASNAGGSRRSTCPPIKIALLDTGIDADDREVAAQEIRITHPTLRAQASRIKGIWKPGMQPLEGMQDKHGHGTHAAGLILMIAPFAELYVAQVSSSNGNFQPDAKVVGEAIHHAVKTWQADIIVMSFGFPPDHAQINNIEEELQTASEAHAMMFAASCNHGNLMPATFPATHPSTIAVRSVNSYCTSGSAFNPTHDGYPRTPYNFAVMGENVESTWPRHLNIEGKKQQTGNSVATPILAAVAANVLELVQMKLGAERGSCERAMWGEIRRQTQGQGIRRALGCLVQNIGDPRVDFVQPGEAFESGNAWTKLKAEFRYQQ